MPSNKETKQNIGSSSPFPEMITIILNASDT